MFPRCYIALVIILSLMCQQDNTPETVHSPYVRGLADSVGFSFTKDQIAAVAKLSETLESQKLQKIKEEYKSPWIAGVCPHDDHLLAGRVYVPLLRNFNAKHYIIFGVAHKAKSWGVQDVLIFDSFDYWKGPYGLVKTSDLREDIISRLPARIYTINDQWQSLEHSVEGIIPFLQHYVRDAEIVSVLVPHMAWETLNEISIALANALDEILRKNNWKLGEDLALIFSNDGDHYGNQDWGGSNYAEFGTDETGYAKATQRDLNLIATTLTGELRPLKLKQFCQSVLGEDIWSYKIRWCGRFSVPFGLNTLYHLSEKQNIPVSGHLLRYDTSYGLGKMQLENICLGTTAPNNIHHWVGYSAIGYR